MYMPHFTIPILLAILYIGSFHNLSTVHRATIHVDTQVPLYADLNTLGKYLRVVKLGHMIKQVLVLLLLLFFLRTTILLVAKAFDPSTLEVEAGDTCIPVNSRPGLVYIVSSRTARAT